VISITLYDLVEFKKAFCPNKNEYKIKKTEIYIIIRIMLYKNTNDNVFKLDLQSVSKKLSIIVNKTNCITHWEFNNFLINM
jgi:hypothetical protein